MNKILLPIVVGALLALPLTSFAGGPQAGAAAGSYSGAGAAAVLDASRGDTRYEAADMGDRVPDTVVSIPSTANNCALSAGVGGSIAGFGIGGGGTYESEECNLREDSTQAARLGDKATAFEIMCAKERFYLGNRRAVESGLPVKFACSPNTEFDRKFAASQGRAQEVTAAVSPLSNDDAFSWQITAD